MIESLKDSRGYIYAYIIFHVFDSEGRIRKNGKYGYIQDIWVHPNCRITDFNRSMDIISELVKKADENIPDHVEFIYWRNDKHSRVTKPYKRNRLSKMGVKHAVSTT